MSTDVLPAETPTRPSSAAEVLANTRALLPLVAEETATAEAQARLTPKLARAFRDAGVFEMGFPAGRGGLEMSLVDQVRVVADVSRVDAGIGWNVGVLNATGYYAGRLGQRAYDELYPTRDMPTSGAFHPKGRADVVDGGYLVSGNWDWGSGSYIAEHVVGGVNVFDAGEPVIAPTGRQLVLGVWLPREAIVHADNWQTLGVRASGSSSYSIPEPVFVPAEHAFDREALPNPDADPLNKHVTTAFFGLTGVCMGIAQHALDLAVETVRRKAGPGGGGKVDPSVRRLLGQAAAEIDLMVAGVTEIARRSDEILFSPGGLLTPVQESRLTVTNVSAAETMRRVVELCLEVYGSRYVFDDDPFQRVLRDAHSAVAHAGTKRMHWGLAAAQILDDEAGVTTLLDEPVPAWP
jgi:indole-3-acetate monooxygenase